MMNLITRSDFDGLACGALLLEAGIIDSYTFKHPKDIQDGLMLKHLLKMEMKSNLLM